MDPETVLQAAYSITFLVTVYPLPAVPSIATPKSATLATIELVYIRILCGDIDSIERRRYSNIYGIERRYLWWRQVTMHLTGGLRL